MQNLSQHIIQLNNRILVSYTYLTQWYSSEYSRKAVSQSKWNSPKKGWICFNSILESNSKIKRTDFKKELPTLKDLEAILAEEAKKPSSVLMAQAKTWEKDIELDYFLKTDGTTQAYEYTAISAWKRMIYTLGQKENKLSLKSKGFKNKKVFLSECVKCIKALNFSKWTCKDFVVLNQQIFVQYAKLVEEYGIDLMYRTIRDERTEISCKNSAKITQQIQQDYLVYLASDHRKFNFELITQMYNVRAAEKEWQVVKTSQPIIDFLELSWIKPVWQMQREPKIYKDTYIPIIGRRKPSFAGAVWEFDGTIVDIYHSGDEDKKQLYARIYWVAVIDVKTEAIIGYHITTSETSHSVVQALKSAIKITNTVPYQLRTDNSSAVKSLMKKGKEGEGNDTNFFEKIAKYVTPAAVGNARAKTIESVFRRFQDSLMRLHPFWAGMNLTVKNDSNRMNKVWITANIKHAPSSEELISQLGQLVTLWNADCQQKDSVSRWQQFKNDADKQRTALRSIFNNAFLITARGHSQTGLITYRNTGIKFVWVKQEYTFKVVDKSINSQLIGKKFIVKFDTDDLEQIWLYNEDNTPYLWNEEHLSITSYEAVPDYLGDRQEGDGERIAEMQEEQKQVNKEHKKAYDEILSRLTYDLKEPITAASVKKDLMNDAEIIAKEMGITKTVSLNKTKQRAANEKEMSLEEWEKDFLDRMSS